MEPASKDRLNRQLHPKGVGMTDIKQALLYVPTFPDAVPLGVLESAARLARTLNCRLTAEIPQIDGDPATWVPLFGIQPVEHVKMMESLAATSERNAGEAGTRLETICKGLGVTLDLRREFTTFYTPPTRLADLSRLHDLVILPAPQRGSVDHSALNATVFDGGRPVVALPPSGKPLRFLERVMVAWDFSKEAARAFSDAMPLIARARDVHVVTIKGEKGIKTSCSAADLENYLRAHNVNFRAASLAIGNETIAECLLRHAKEIDADLLVMGAYGHSRFRELVLGGATRGVLREPPLPVLFSH